MLSRTPSVRRSFPLVVAVFLLGAGIGALVIALTRSGTPKRVTVGHALTAAATDPHTSRRPAPAPANEGTPAPARAASSAGLVSERSRRSFDAFASSLGGRVGLAVAPLGEGPIERLGSLQAGHAWSTMKVPVLTTLLVDIEHGEARLSSRESEDAALALEQSDNAAAEALFGELKVIHGGLVPASEAVQETLRVAGDGSTRVNTAPNSGGFTTWGQTIWSTTGEVEFYRALAGGCLLRPRDTAYVLHLMRNVISSQRWGAGEAGYPAALPLAFKAGWGPESSGGYLVRQTAIVGSGRDGYVLSVIALPAGGSFAEGVSMVTALARWARRALPSQVSAPPATCAAAQ
jgi:hypothetical protein